MHEVPDADADASIPALVDLCGLYDLLLKRSWEVPVDHVARTLVLIGSHHEASVVWSQAGGEHAGTPWPPSLPHVQARVQVGVELLLVHDLYVVASMQGLLLTWVGDL